MAESEICVDVDQLKRDKEDMTEILKLLRKSLVEIEAELIELGGMWEGTTRSAFIKQTGEDKRGMDTLCDTMQKILGNVAYAEQQYRKCEINVEAIVAAIKL